MRQILIALLILFFCSCSKNYYIRKYCPTITKDSIYVHDTTIFHDTTFIVQERISLIHDTVPCADFILKKYSGGIHQIIQVKNKKITAECKCDAVELKARLYEKTRTVKHIRELTRYIKSPKTNFQKFKDWYFWISIILFIILIILWILLKIYKWTFPIKIN